MLAVQRNEIHEIPTVRNQNIKGKRGQVWSGVALCYTVLAIRQQCMCTIQYSTVNYNAIEQYNTV